MNYVRELFFHAISHIIYASNTILMHVGRIGNQELASDPDWSIKPSRPIQF